MPNVDLVRVSPVFGQQFLGLDLLLGECGTRLGEGNVFALLVDYAVALIFLHLF